MCGAFSILHPFKELGSPFNAGYNGPDLGPKPNARPGQMLPVILNSEPDEVKLALWGVKPAWKKTGGAIINTRKESLETKSVFMESFHKRRCLIPADGFYEWAQIASKKVPYLFRLKSKNIFAFAGIWQTDKTTGQPAFTIITIAPNLLVKKIHDRMPAVLPPLKERLWLDEETNPLLLINMLNPYPQELMESLPAPPLTGAKPTANTLF
ncbi:MAG: SOS response-associated peptidase [Patescibacteria group bacterium]|nr:SOS response-associated peptidase [Patescibacteria group bacterium]